MMTATRWLGLLGLVIGAAGCQDYGTRSDPCKGLDCRLECVNELDCPNGFACVLTEGGCCSQCEPTGCQTDADCPVCEVCDPASAECLATPCAPECLDDSDCGPNGRCLPDESGCCMQCVTDDPCADLDCVATCVVDADCPPEAVCHVYEDGCCSMCLLANQEVLLQPTCVHAPSVVGAGGEFPLAVFGYPGCGWFDRVEVEAAGFDIQVRLVGRASADPDCPTLVECAHEDWAYLGLIWLSAPNPGAYTVSVSGSHQRIVGASGGIVEDPVCQDDCAWPDLQSQAWTWVSQSPQRVTGSCGGHLTVDQPLRFDGGCQDYSLDAEDWPLPTAVRLCRDGWLSFGPGPFFRAEASVCAPNDPVLPATILGVGWVGDAGDQQAEAFLFQAQ